MSGPSWLEDWAVTGAAEVSAWRRHLHAHPELSMLETATTAFVVDRLRALGLAPRVLAGGTGVICDLGDGPGPLVALRADMDALPLDEATDLPFASTVAGVCHACGHDAHTAILLGVAAALVGAGPLPGRVRLLFQPSEEQMAGARLLIDAGALEGVSRIFALHCDPHLAAGLVGVRSGPLTSAADIVELQLRSPGGHTSRPHLTADLVHALGTVITGLPALLSRRIDPRAATVLVWGAVNAGVAPNAIPRAGSLRGTLRTADRETWALLEPVVAEAVAALLAPTGVAYELHHTRGVPPVVNEEASAALLAAAVAAALGEHAVVPTAQSSGGEDFAWYLEHVPGAMARLGTWGGAGPVLDLHQASFDLDERALQVGVRTLVHCALACWSEGARGGA